MANRGSLSDFEKDKIKELMGSKSVSAIARHIGRDRRTVDKYIKKLKKNPPPKREVEPSNPLQKLSIKKKSHLRSFSEEERESFFKENLQNSQYYDNLKLQFTDRELNYYLEEWGALCVQFEDIVNTDRRQIDEYIKTGIIGNRILRNIRVSEDEIEELMKEAEVLGNVKEIEEDEDMQNRYDTLRHLILTFSSQVQSMVNDYGKNQDARTKLLESLNTRRKDRVNQIKKSGTSLFDLIQTLDEPEYRDDQGYYLEVMKLSKEHLKHEWRQPQLLPDGSKDCILIDEHSEEPQVQIIENTEGTVDTIKNLMVGGPRLNIIVVHNRSKLFPKVLYKAFAGHNVTYLETFDGFVKELEKRNTVHYVFLGYHLNDNTDTRDVCRHVLEESIMEKTKFYITTDNQTLNEEVANVLIGYREFEMCLTKEIEEKVGR